MLSAIERSSKTLACLSAGREYTQDAVEVGFGPSKIDRSDQMDAMKPQIVAISEVHHIVSSGLESDLVDDVDIVRIANGDANRRGDRSAQIQQCIHLDVGLGGARMRSWK